MPKEDENGNELVEGEAEGASLLAASAGIEESLVEAARKERIEQQREEAERENGKWEESRTRSRWGKRTLEGRAPEKSRWWDELSLEAKDALRGSKFEEASWEACERVPSLERADYWEFVVRSFLRHY